MRTDELMAEAKRLGAPYHVLVETAELGKLPVPNFAAGGIATPADASLMMQLGAETVFVGSGIFASEDPAPRAKAIVDAVTFFDEDTPTELIAALLPDVLVKGADWAHYIAGREEVEAAGGTVMALPLEPGYSTTGVIEELLRRP